MVPGLHGTLDADVSAHAQTRRDGNIRACPANARSSRRTSRQMRPLVYSLRTSLEYARACDLPVSSAERSPTRRSTYAPPCIDPPPRTRQGQKEGTSGAAHIRQPRLMAPNTRKHNPDDREKVLSLGACAGQAFSANPSSAPYRHGLRAPTQAQNCVCRDTHTRVSDMY